MEVIDFRPDKRGVWVCPQKNVPSTVSSQKLEIVVVLAIIIPTNPVLVLIVSESAWPIVITIVLLYSAVIAAMTRAILYLLKMVTITDRGGF